MISQHPVPHNPTTRRNVEFVLEQGGRLDLVCMRDPTGAAPPAHPRLRIYAFGLRHRRSSRLWYPYEYLAFMLRALPRVTWLSLRHRYAAIQVDNLPDFLVFLALLGKLRGARVVLFMFELMPEMTATRLGVSPDHWIVRLARGLERAATRFADQVVAVSVTCRRILAQRGVPEARLTVVYNTQPERVPVPDPEPGGDYLITHATLVERYGVQVLLRAFNRLRDRHPDLRLQVLGEGEYLPELLALTARLGLEDRVSFPGYLPWVEAMRRIRGARLGVVPVLADGYGEIILPMKLLDYVRFGLPAVSSYLPTIAEHFPEGSVAYCPPGDDAALAEQIDRLLRRPDAARRQAELAAEALEPLRWEHSSRNYLAALTGDR